MEYIADLHIHSHYSRATSRSCVPEKLDLWARQKGIHLLGTGDFTHRAWRTELAQKLEPAEEGCYRLRNEYQEAGCLNDRPVRFIVSGEISSIYKKNGRTRKVHNLILLPNLETAERLSVQLETVGNLHSDGRPILGLDSKILLDMTLSVCPDALFIPAHIWTPHFSVLGANSGFDSIDECYDDLSAHIFAVETGLSSDPPMNWRLSDLDRFVLVSNSDAHSPANLAREANIFDTDCTYPAVYTALKYNDRSAFKGTIEFFPEEGKYHYDGHRACNIRWEPGTTIAAAGVCPVCGRQLTVGVLHRTEVLADRPESFRPENARSYLSVTSLPTIIGASLGCGSMSRKATACYISMLEQLGSELSILRSASINDIQTVAGDLVAEGVRRVREGQLRLAPGYDGNYGVIEIFSEGERKEFSGQTVLFADLVTVPVKNLRRKSVTPIVRKSPTTDEAPDQNVSETLDPEQQIAVTAGDGTQMVIAGPGTGKTRTLVNRIRYLIDTLHIGPDTITAVTFTNKAAGEMRERCAAFLPECSLNALTIGTFHGICLKLLKENDPENPPILIDEFTALSLLRELIDEYQIAGTPAALLRIFSRAKTSVAPVDLTLDPETLGWYLRYQEKLTVFGAIDFDDLLRKTLILSQSSTTGTPLRKRFHYLLVDEFQDINEMQYELVKEWGRPDGNIFVIGDPHQSIYGFRGASPEFFQRFTTDFPQTLHCTLIKNYRSPKAVVETAKSVISHAAEAAMQPARFSAVQSGSSSIRLVTARNEFTQARFIAETINRLIGGVDMLDAHRYTVGIGKSRRSYGFSDIAVLYRTHRQAEIIERSLIEEGIAYRIAGRDTSLFTTSVATIIAVLRFIINPADIVALTAILRHFKVAIDIAVLYADGERTLDNLVSILDRHLYCNVATFIRRCDILITEDAPADVVSGVGEAMGFSEDESICRLTKIAELASDTHAFVHMLILGDDADIIRSGFGQPHGDAVLLSTLHAAKGLEFPVTIICGVNEGVLPHQDTHGFYSDIDEERRLFYVGITRAREQLICTLTHKRMRFGESIDCLPSRFTQEIDETYLVREKYRIEPIVTQLSLF